MLEQPVPSTPINRKPWFWITIAGVVLVLACCLGVAASAFTSDDTVADDSGIASETQQEDSPSPGSDETTDESPEVIEIEMPSVVDLNAAVARDELERLGFTNVQFGSLDEEHNTIGVVNPANWTVIEQSHEPGRLVPADAVIVLGCVKN